MSASRSRRGHTVASLHERALLRAAQQDDRHALEELLRRYEPLARAIAGRLRLPAGCDRCDVVQEARLGVLAAIRVWRPDRGPFGALAAQCAKARALHAVDAAGARKHRLLSHATPLQDAPASGQAGQRQQPSIVVGEQHAAVSADGDPVAILLTREQLAEIRAALPTLTARERAPSSRPAPAHSPPDVTVAAAKSRAASPGAHLMSSGRRRAPVSPADASSRRAWFSRLRSFGERA